MPAGSGKLWALSSTRVNVAVLAAAMFLAGCGGPDGDRAALQAIATAPPAATAPTATPIRPAFSSATSSRGCAATVRWGGSTGGAGVIFGRFDVAAVPGYVCRFRGLPVVTLLDAAGRPRPTHEGPDTLVTPSAAYRKIVEIRAGHPATFEVVYQHGLPSGRACRQAFGIDVGLPPSDLHYRVPVEPRGGVDDHHAFNPCGGSLAVGAIRLDDER